MLRVYLIYYYKVFNHLTPCNPNDVFIIYSPDACSTLNLPYLEKPIKVTHRLLSVLFSEVLMPGINALSPALRSSSSLSAHKRTLKQFGLSAYLKGSAV
jgi:hypothetical protein